MLVKFPYVRYYKVGDCMVMAFRCGQKLNLKKRSDLPGEINSDIKNMCSNKQNATLKQKIMVQDNKKNVVLD